MAEPIVLTVDGQVATVTINRPERMNAMDSVTHLALSETLDALADAEDIRVVVLTGAGDKAFSAGRDLKELAGSDRRSPDEQGVIDERWRRVTRLTDRFDYPKPLIARVQGLALGGGFELAMACDIIIASDTASFALPEPRRGLIPFAGGVHRLPRQIPLKTAMGHLMTGRPISAARGWELGLVNEVVPSLLLDETVAIWAQDLIACAPLALRSIKQCVAQGLGRPLADAMSATYPAEDSRVASEDAREGPRSFAEKRLPVWRGR